MHDRWPSSWQKKHEGREGSVRCAMARGERRNDHHATGLPASLFLPPSLPLACSVYLSAIIAAHACAVPALRRCSRAVRGWWGSHVDDTANHAHHASHGHGQFLRKACYVIPSASLCVREPLMRRVCADCECSARERAGFAHTLAHTHRRCERLRCTRM